MFLKLSSIFVGEDMELFYIRLNVVVVEKFQFYYCFRNLNECNSSHGYQLRRKHSWSHDSDSGMSSTEGSMNGSHSSISSVHSNVGPQSEALQKIVAIVKRTGKIYTFLNLYLPCFG